VAVVVITILILISILFEMGTELLRDSTDELNMPFVNTVFSELTTLGFIGLLLFVVTKLEVLAALSSAFLGDEAELQESIEELHMALFLFILIFLVLCCALLKLGLLVQAEWREFERGHSDIPAVVSDYVLSTEPPLPTSGWFERCATWLSRDLAARKAHREMVYLALRRRFVDYRSNHPDPEMAKMLAKEFQLNRDDAARFPFNEYLSIISGEVMGRLIAIDLPTWVALEVLLVIAVIMCHAAGTKGEVVVLLLGGLALIGLNYLVRGRVKRMRQLLTPPRLLKDAERLRRKNEWRARHQLALIQTSEKSWILEDAKTGDDDDAPPYIDLLPRTTLESTEWTEASLAEQQRKLLGGGSSNGVVLALFSTRLVFLLTALHLAVFLVRGANLVAELNDGHWFRILLLDALFLLPSVVVTSMSVRIARDGLYAFNVEHMKVSRVVIKVTRILRARQTLRTLRFVAEMKVYLRENVRRHSRMLSPSSTSPTSSSASYQSGGLPITASLHESSARFSTLVAKKTGWRAPTLSSKGTASPPSSPLTSQSSAKGKSLRAAVTAMPKSNRRLSIGTVAKMAAANTPAALTPTSTVPSPPLSPLAAYMTPREKRSDAYKLETERREIHTIFCLFDLDGSGSVSRDEMVNLLTAITHELDEAQLNRLMADLVGSSADSPNGDEDEEITFEAFYNWCHQHIQDNRHSKEEMIEEIFKMIDTDGSGFITVDEFVAIFKTLGQSLDHDDVRELVYQMDRNNDGKIDLEEFTKMLEKHEV
jgi:calcium-binding protein CML